MTPGFSGYAVAPADPLPAGALVAGSLLAGALVTGALLGGGAPLVTGPPAGGELLTCGGELVGGGGGGDELVEGGAEPGGRLDGVAVSGAELLGGLDGGGAELAGGPDGGLDAGFDGGLDPGDPEVPPLDGGGVLVDWEDPGGAGGVDDPLDAPLDAPPGSPPDVPSDVPADVPPGPPPPDSPPATLSVTYSPNRSSVPAGGSDAVTLAPLGGSPAPAYPTARPESVSRRLACPNVVPASFGTARRFWVSNVESSSPVVPTGRLMPRSGSPTSTRAIRSSARGAGRTATTRDRS